MKDERFLYPGKSPHWWGQRGSFGKEKSLKRSTATESKVERDLQRWLVLQLRTPQPEMLIASVGGSWVLRLGLQRSDLGREMGWAAWR